MKIDRFQLEEKSDRVRASAVVTWEDCDRPAQELYFETSTEFADGFSCNPHSFLVACILPAFRFGEKRIYMDAEICPELKDGLATVMMWIRRWYYEPEKALVQIEAKKQANPLPQPKQRAGMLFSGGIDSLATLRANRIHYPLEHPGSIKDGLVVYGLEVDEEEKFDHVLNSISEIARNGGITLIPVYTNIRDLGPEDSGEFWGFWTDKFEASVWSAVAHAFSKRLMKLYVNSSFDIPNLHPHGSHPLIDPNYSSYSLRICHDGIALSRFGKTKLIADWDVALQYLRVCNNSIQYQTGIVNCCECEKCVRTMLSFLSLGVLEKTHAFPKREISEELVRSAVYMDKTTMPFYPELLAPLNEIGRHDLVRILKRKMAKRQFINRTILPIKEFDRKYFRSNLLKLKRLVYRKGIT